MAEQDSQTPPELNPVEQEAQGNGWQPQTEFEADPKNAGKKWRSAEDFMDRKSLFDKIEDQHKEIRNLKKGIDALAQHNKTIEEATRERTIKELKEQRNQLLKDGEVLEAEKIRDQITDLQQKQPQSQQPTTQAQAEFQQWIGQNTWYNKDLDMTAWADGMGALLARQGHGPQEVLTMLHQQARQKFPEKFNSRNPNKDDAPVVGASSSKRATPDSFRMTSEEERVMNKMIRAGAKITPEEYKAQLKKAKGY